jgi:Sulfotransferase family
VGSLQPLLVDYFTRDGSTLLMRLLATSPQIAVGGGYPYEHKYFAYLFRWAHLIDKTEWPRRYWNGSHLATLAQESLPQLGPPPWMPRELLGPDDTGTEFSEAAFRMLWDEFSRRATEQTRRRSKSRDAEVRYYAEKHLSTWTIDRERLPPLKVIALLRDPRDTYVSILAFTKRRREEGRTASMGQRPGETAEAWLTRHLERQRERMRWIHDALERGTMPVVRYEDLVLDLEGEARRLEAVLDVKLDAAAVSADSRMRRAHVSADSPEASIGRWRREMRPGVLSRFNDELGDEMSALGFAVSEPSQSARGTASASQSAAPST